MEKGKVLDREFIEHPRLDADKQQALDFYWKLLRFAKTDHIRRQAVELCEQLQVEADEVGMSVFPSREAVAV